MTKISTKKGFTLIELLVVIAIIGILSAIVLTNLASARSRANAAKIQEQLSGIRAAAETYYSANNTYPVSTSCTSGGWTDSTSGLGNLTLAANYPSGTALVCDGTATAWAVSASLPSGSATGFWCVDSAGDSKGEAAALTGSATVCS